ncbi:MAG: hypothetical protein ACRCYU_09825, partial [Nocardioides sp.]
MTGNGCRRSGPHTAGLTALGARGRTRRIGRWESCARPDAVSPPSGDFLNPAAPRAWTAAVVADEQAPVDRLAYAMTVAAAPTDSLLGSAGVESAERRARGCSRPVRLRGAKELVDTTTGEVRTLYSS